MPPLQRQHQHLNESLGFTKENEQELNGTCHISYKCRWNFQIVCLWNYYKGSVLTLFFFPNGEPLAPVLITKPYPQLFWVCNKIDLTPFYFCIL